ncbi:MAG: hypothetical protein R6U84_03320 [Candidatus Cloacimonadales bacterium]
MQNKNISRFPLYDQLFVAWALCLLLCLPSCSSIETQPTILDPLAANEILNIPINFPVQKAVHDKISQTTFVMSNNQIFIYRQNQRINSIGRLGFTATNFNKLSDIALSPAGNLLALDGFRRIIYRYDQNGSLLSQFQLKEISKPALLLQSNDETIFVYDEASNEVFVVDPLAESDLISFGKFSFQQPTQISRYKNKIYLYDSLLDQTFFFNTFGQELEVLPGFVFLDQHQKFQLDKYYFTHQASSQKFAISPSEIINCCAVNDLIILLRTDEISIIEMKYARKI